MFFFYFIFLNCTCTLVVVSMITLQCLTRQSLDSDELVSMTTDLSDLTRSLSDLCIQAYQQLLSITETQLQKLIGNSTVTSRWCC